MMKPKAQSEHEEGMLEYLEDIIGSSRFKEPIEKLANEVEALNDARGEKVFFPLNLGYTNSHITVNLKLCSEYYFRNYKYMMLWAAINEITT